MPPSAEVRECVVSTIRRAGLSLGEWIVLCTVKYEGSTVASLPGQSAFESSGYYLGDISVTTANAAMDSLFSSGLIEVITASRRANIFTALDRPRVGPVYNVPRPQTVTLTDTGANLSREIELSLSRVMPWKYSQLYFKQRSTSAIPYQMLCYGQSVERLRSFYVHKTLENGRDVIGGVMPIDGHYPGPVPFIANPPIVLRRPRFYLHWYNWIEPCVLMKWNIIRQHSAGD